MDRNVYSTEIARLNFSERHFEILSHFLVQEQHQIRIPDQVVRNSIFEKKTLTRTAISTLFETALRLGKMDRVLFFRVPKDISDVPEVATYTHFTLDVLQMQDVNTKAYRTLLTSPFKDRILINVTPWMKRDSQLSDVQGVHTITVRDLLVRSFYMEKDIWLTPSLAREMSRFYGLVIGSVIGRTFNLSFPERRSVSAIFTAWMMLQCATPRSFLQFFRSNERELGYEKSDIVEIGTMFEEMLKRKDVITIRDAIEMTKHVNPVRMKTISFKALSTRIRGWDLNLYSSHMGLMYPPAFLHMLLSVDAGRKSSMSFEIKRLNLNRDLKTVIQTLTRTDLMFLQI